MKRKLDDILDSVLNRDGGSDFYSLIVPNHLAQMKLFGIRQGVDFVPVQDRNNLRKKKLDDIIRFNKLDIWLERLWDLLLCKGKILFYLRPTGNTYKFYFFHKDQFRTYFAEDGTLNEVIICYTYKIRRSIGQIQNDRWIKLWITDKEIRKLESDTPLSIEEDLNYNTVATSEGSNGDSGRILNPGIEVYPNNLGWIPCVETVNYLVENEDGHNEFSWIASHLEIQDELEGAVSDNLLFFGNQTLVATRGLEELTEALGHDREVERRSFSARSGFGGRKSKGRYPGIVDREKGLRIRKVIGNVQPEERFGYISPDPVTGDHNLYVADRREALRTALGGVDELGVHSGATAFEIKSIFGRAAATARKKCTHLYNYGICAILQKAIQAEEQIWLRGLQEILSDPKMAKSILEAVYPQADPKALKNTIEGLSQGMEIPEEISRAIADSGLSLNLEGLPPLGDSTVTWRWTGPVYEESSQDRLNSSIIGRNMDEVGIDRWSVLRFIYPDKTDEELKDMTGSDTSIPFRRIQQTSQAIGQLFAIYQQLSQTPHPYKPGLPLGADLDLLPSLQSIIEKLQNDVQHSRTLQPASPIESPTFSPFGSNAGDNAGDSKLPSRDSREPGDVSPYSTYFGYANRYSDPPTGGEWGQSLATGIQRAGGIFESASIPSPGATVNTQPIRQQHIPSVPAAIPASAGSDGSSSVSPIPPIPPDMGNQPGLVEQLFPTFSRAISKSKPSKSKSRRKK